MNEDTVIYVVGFVGKHGGNGGFEWRVEREEAEAIEAEYLTYGTYDVSKIQVLTLEQLALDGNFTPEAVTDALDSEPELWEPPEGAARGDYYVDVDRGES